MGFTHYCPPIALLVKYSAVNKMSTARSSSKRISQATFDDAVRENMETFGQTVEEAVADAIAQFESAGVDLSNIVKGDSSAHPVLSSLRTLQTFLVNAVPSLSEVFGSGETSSAETPAHASAASDSARLRDALHALDAEIVREPAASRAVAASNGAVKILTLLVAAAAGHHVGSAEVAPELANALLLLAALRTLRTLVADAGDCHRLVAVGFAPVLVAVADACGSRCAPVPLGEAAPASPSTLLFSSAAEAATVQAATMHLAAALATKREGFKIALFNAGAPRILAAALEDASAVAAAAAGASADGAAAADAAAKGAAASGGTASALLASVHAPRVAAASSAVARLLADDDLSVEASKAFAFARTLAMPQPAAGSATPLATAAAAAAASRPASAGTVASVGSASPSEAAIARASSDMAGLGLVPRLIAGLRVFLHDP